MMLGTIRARHLVYYAVTIIRCWGFRRYCHCWACVMRRKVTTFLAEVSK
jgi:hypothetical protein